MEFIFWNWLRKLKMRKICGLVLFVVLGLTSTAMAEGELLSEEFHKCMQKAAGIADMTTCIAVETQKQDARLNAVYEELMTNLPKDQQMSLYEAQLAWIKFRGTFSDFLYEYEEGNMGLITSGYWYVYSTAEQARQLEFLLCD